VAELITNKITYQKLVEEIKLGNNDALEELTQRFSNSVAPFVANRFRFLLSEQDIRDDMNYLVYSSLKYFDSEKSSFQSYMYKYGIKTYIYEKIREINLIKEPHKECRNFVEQIDDLRYHNQFDKLEKLLKEKTYLELDKVDDSHYCYVPDEYKDNGLEEIICNVVKTQFSEKAQYIFFQYVYEDRFFADIAKDLNITKQQVRFLYNKHAEYLRYVVNKLFENKVFITYKDFRKNKLAVDKKRKQRKKSNK